jgi:hypothetical protein
MAKEITINIPLIVGSNGKWCANGYTSTEKDGVDWAFMADNLEDESGNYPAAERRYMVTTVVVVPDEEPEVAIGVAVEQE